MAANQHHDAVVILVSSLAGGLLTGKAMDLLQGMAGGEPARLSPTHDFFRRASVILAARDSLALRASLRAGRRPPRRCLLATVSGRPPLKPPRVLYVLNNPVAGRPRPPARALPGRGRRGHRLRSAVFPPPPQTQTVSQRCARCTHARAERPAQQLTPHCIDRTAGPSREHWPPGGSAQPPSWCRSCRSTGGGRAAAPSVRRARRSNMRGRRRHGRCLSGRGWRRRWSSRSSSKRWRPACRGKRAAGATCKNAFYEYVPPPVEYWVFVLRILNRIFWKIGLQNIWWSILSWPVPRSLAPSEACPGRGGRCANDSVPVDLSFGFDGLCCQAVLR